MTDLTQLINFNGEFMASVEDWMVKENFTNKGFSFTVITVLGCQSSGKSTLLNELFGTSFEVMDSTQGRNQTTKGLWLGADKKESVLVIDVEGTDSRERGEDRLTFEHRASLFSLALADIVIVNMWYHDLGRYTASNYGLLKTVLGVNLELFQQQKDAPKTIMMFVIRDYTESQTPLDKLEQMIRTDIRAIWKDTSKPEHLSGSTADDFFEFKTVGLPSKFAETKTFKEKCTKLRSLIMTECRPKTYSRQIPADGFGFYAKSVWETILRSSDLDIPSQKEMLATYRCEELKNAALSEATASFPEYLSQAQKGALPATDFSWAASKVELALELYDGPASRYQKSVYLKKREQLLHQLQSELQKIVEAHLTHVRHRLATDAASALDLLFCQNYDSIELIGGLPKLECWSKFPETTDRWRDQTMHKFSEMVSSLSLIYINSEDKSTRRMDFDSTQARQSLLESLEASLIRMREKQQSEFLVVLSTIAADRLGELDLFFTDIELTPEKYWKSITQIMKNVRVEILESLGSSWLGIQTSEHSHSELWELEATKGLFRQLRAKLERICEWLQNHIVSRFHFFFDQDEQGVPRQWQNLSSEKIKEIYMAAREKSLVVLEIFDTFGVDLAELKLEADSFDKQLLSPLLTDSKRQQVLVRANKQMQRACQEAQLIQTTGGRGQSVPWWMWGLLLAFGYNEISLLLFSPVSLLLVISGLFVGGICFLSGNLQLPMQLSRHLVGMFASTMVSVLGTLQQNPTTAPVIPKLEVKEE